MSNPYAYFDSLAICAQIQDILGNIAISEIHLFAYLSSLLAVYERNPVSFWQYQFSVTRNGYPFSPAIGDSIRELISRSKIEQNDDFINLTNDGKGEYNALREFSGNQEREIFIEGACSSTLVMPVGVIRKAISQDSEIRGAVELRQDCLLMTDESLTEIKRQFQIISSKIGNGVIEIMVPAVVWLAGIYQKEIIEKKDVIE